MTTPVPRPRRPSPTIQPSPQAPSRPRRTADNNTHAPLQHRGRHATQHESPQRRNDNQNYKP